MRAGKCDKQCDVKRWECFQNERALTLKIRSQSLYTFVQKNQLMRSLLLGLASLFLLISCSEKELELKYTLRGRAQGTTYSIVYMAPSGRDYHTQVDSVLFEVDRSLSAWNPNSTLSKVNSGELDSVVDPLFITCIKAGQRISRETGGAFDMTVGPLVNFWGFGAEQRGELDSAVVDSLLELTGFYNLRVGSDGKITRPRGLKIDVNAIAQGYSVDLLAEWFDTKGITNYLIEVGGEMKARGVNLEGNPWIVGIDKPSEEIQEQRFQVIVNLDSASLATSGNYRKFFVDSVSGIKYSHTIDPQTGYPVRDRLLSVSIVTPSCMDADAIATACMVMGLDKAKAFVQSRSDIEAYFVFGGLTGDWEVWSTEGFDAMVH